MFSRTDIIRTLENKNCTNESILSLASSPDCTAQKLLEKLTEIERFDLALDISMRLGLDVTILWRTWAMRCLKHRNFQGAREKFRHCFHRLRLRRSRVGPVQSNILADILNELTKLDEIHIPLAEEVELIKVSNSNPATGHSSSDNYIAKPKPIITSKPKIHSECIYYLSEYGSTPDRVRFYIRNELWDDAVQLLLDKSDEVNLTKFFIGEVVQYSNSTGHFAHLIDAFLKADPTFKLSTKYFQSIYDFCKQFRRFNLLHYVQSSIGDHVAAADTQINTFFLRRPVQSYRELNHRIPSLVKAQENYKNYLEKVRSNQSPSLDGANELFSLISKDEAEKQLRLISLQIEITRNFAINEVSGCVDGVDLATIGEEEQTLSSEDLPATLFDKTERRKIFLAALVLIYFDLSCSAYFSKHGLDLARQLIREEKLDKIKVFKTAMRIIIEDESCDILENAALLLERIEEDYRTCHEEERTGCSRPELVASSRPNVVGSSKRGSIVSSATSEEAAAAAVTPEDNIRSICDEVIRDSIKSCREPDYKMELAKLLSGEAKIELYIEHGKLSNAQRLACKMNRPDYVSSIIDEAVRLNQNHVKTVCQLWLAKH